MRRRRTRLSISCLRGIHERKLKNSCRHTIEKAQNDAIDAHFSNHQQRAKRQFFSSKARQSRNLARRSRGEFQPEKLPAQRVKPESGELFWLIDEAAARFL
jgi:hypothetical protein